MSKVELKKRSLLGFVWYILSRRDLRWDMKWFIIKSRINFIEEDR